MIKSIYFFAGNWRCCRELPAVQFYKEFATPNEVLYTAHSVVPHHLGWSKQPKNSIFALE